MTERTKLIPSSFDFFAGFGTLQMQVAGFHRAVPSATLDKAYSVDGSIIGKSDEKSTPDFGILLGNGDFLSIPFGMFIF